MINRTVVGKSAAVLGVALLIMGAWQLNQWYTTQAQIGSTLGLLSGSLSALGGEGVPGIDGAAAQAIAGITNAYLTTAIADLVIGLVLLLASSRLLPTEHHH